MSSLTIHFNFYLPAAGDGDENGMTWFDQVNGNFVGMDSALHAHEEALASQDESITSMQGALNSLSSLVGLPPFTTADIGKVPTVVEGPDIAWRASGSGGSGGGSDSGITNPDWMWPKSSAIPMMTSNVTPSGVVSASSAYYTTPPWYAFDADHVGWVTDGTGLGTPQWIQYAFTNPKNILSYSIMPWSNDSFPTRCLTAWHLDGSNDEVNWNTLDTRIRNMRRWVPYLPAYFTVTSPGSYRYYRLVITGNGGNPYVGIQRLELYES